MDMSYVTIKIPDGYASAEEFLKDCQFEQMETSEWKNLDRIIDALEKAGCCHNGYINAPEDIVAHAIRDWLSLKLIR